ncbi:MAG: V-type ATP synthase subunit A [Pseudomonadota bacterium]
MKERKARIVMVDDNLVVVDLGGSAKKGITAIMNEEGFIGPLNLRGELIRVRGSHADLQSYEDTTGLMVNDEVMLTGNLIDIELGPGLLTSVLDGLGNSLKGYGDFLPRGERTPTLDKEKKWEFKPTKQNEEEVLPGDIIGTVQETSLIEHRIMIPPYFPKGKIKDINSGPFTVEEAIGTLVDSSGKEYELKLYQRWPIRIPRPVLNREKLTEPLVTGIRVIDGFNPIMRGGTACIPGDFGTGKTMCQHDLSRHSKTHIVIYVGCGERAGEMVELIKEFPELKDPETGLPLEQRTVLLVNTSAMPVAAREGSILVGATLAEYYRDMGYDVLLLTDSLSRQAQGMREMSGRLGEIPGPQAFPAYMSAYLTRWFERSGKVKCLGSPNREGSITTIAALSPDGGDIAGDPPTQAGIQTAKVALILSRKRAAARLFPAFDPMECHSKYLDTSYDELGRFFANMKFPDWLKRVERLKKTVFHGERIKSQVEILGEKGVPDEEYRMLLIGDLIQKGYLSQNTFDPNDNATAQERHYAMLEFFADVIDNFPIAGKQVMRRLQEDLLYKITQANFSKEYEIGYRNILNEMGEQNNKSQITNNK